jgi:excisionase family DNA binding protein
MNTGPQRSPPPEVWRLWRVQDVAKALGMSRTWVYEKAESGELPSLHLGGALRFDPEAIRSYAFGQRRPQAVLPFRKRED